MQNKYSGQRVLLSRAFSSLVVVFYRLFRTAFFRHAGNNPSDSTSNTHTHHAGMHIDYFVKGKSMLYGGPGVKRDYGLILLLTNKIFS
ncbi:hypothetical protein SAMN05216316_2945 [Nitrosovibrio sp. Nv6]|nr:hypothetical protein SAMN05216316_2945 [Nitrosovibrio sp. Nv6]